MFDLHGRTALITGAATGLGQAIAIALAKAGASIAISDKTVDLLEETEALLRSIHQQSLKIKIDVREVGDIKAGVPHVQERFGKIDILINNAGINRPVKG